MEKIMRKGLVIFLRVLLVVVVLALASLLVVIFIGLMSKTKKDDTAQEVTTEFVTEAETEEVTHSFTDALEVDGDVSVSGDVTATGAMYSSDKRLKENIEVVSVEDLENVKNVEFKSFNFISNKDSKRVGVIAQELKDNGLGKFTATNDAGFLTVDYISLLCLKIAELEKEIKELKNNKA